jgi:hypothetical protein
MSSASGSTEKLPRKRRLFNVVEEPYWFPEDIVKAREQLPDNIRLTRSKLRTQQRQQSLHSTPKKGQPLDWPEVEVEDWTVDQPNRTESSNSDFEVLERTVSADSNIVSIESSEASPAALTHNISASTADTDSLSEEATDVTDQTFRSFTSTPQPQPQQPQNQPTSPAREPTQETTKVDDLSKSIEISTSSTAVDTMTEKRPVTGTLTIGKKVYQHDEVPNLVQDLLGGYDELIQFRKDTGGYHKVDLLDLQKHHASIGNHRGTVLASITFMENIEKGNSEFYEMPDLLTKLGSLWHDVSVQIKALQVAAIKARKAQLERDEKAQRDKEKADRAKKHKQRQTNQNNDDESEEEDHSDDRSINLNDPNDRLLRLETMLMDAMAYGQFKGEPVPVKRKPPQVPIKKFKGISSDYARFKQAFKDSYEGTGLSNISLAVSLFEYLDGEASTKLAYLMKRTNIDTYRVMWENLDSFYGNDKELDTKEFLKFEAMPAMRIFNAATISILYTALTSSWSILTEQSGDSFRSEDNIHLVKLLKKIPLREKDRFLDYCNYSNKKANLPVFKDWVIERWNRLKDEQDHGKPDKALQFWQDDVRTTPAHELLESAQTVDQVTVDWQARDTGTDGELMFEVPEGAEFGFYHNRNGELVKVKNVGLKVPFQDRKDRGSKPSWSNKPPPSKGQGTCGQCKKPGHYVQTCESFKKMSVKDRYTSVRDNKLCLRCLTPGHFARDCKAKFTCDVDSCGKRHHRLLHPDKISKVMYQMFFRQGLEDDLPSDSEEDKSQN